MNFGRSLKRDANYVIKVLEQDMKDLKALNLMLLQFFGKTGQLQDLNQVKLLTNYYMVVIPQFLLVMLVYGNVFII